MVRELQPHILVNDRIEIGGDFKTPEQYQPAGRLMVDGQPVTWEACQTLNGSWGYHRDNLDVHLPGLAQQVEYAQLLNDGSEIKRRVIDPHQTAQNTTMGGLAPDTLTLELPVQQPNVAVPMIELFLK